MPRSKCRPNVSTYHEAVSFLLTAIDPGLDLPLTKNQDKFAAKSLCYLAGVFGLCIDAKIQYIYETMQNTYNVPDEFITWVRVLQQATLGVTVPASYGDFDSNLGRVIRFLETLKSAPSTENTTEEEFLEAEEYYAENTRLLASTREEVADQVTPDDRADQGSNVIVESVVNPKPDWDTLAAKNPLAASFVKALMSTPDFEADDDTEFDHHGTWEYEYTEDEEEDEY